jgi:hypothetical protein
MRSAIVLCSLCFLASCSKTDGHSGRSPSAETGMAGAADTAATSPAASLNAVAGKWQTRAISEAGSTLGTAELKATADTTGWTLTFPKQKPIPLQVVAVGGDSIVTAAQYQDFENKKAQIRNRAVLRFQGEKMEAPWTHTSWRTGVIHSSMRELRELGSVGKQVRTNLIPGS